MRSDLPAGTVTFLFTDVEGSTRLLHDSGEEAYAEALAEHRLVLRRTFSRHDGVEVDTQGDAFFYAFPSAEGALRRPEGQQALAAGPIRVRLGLHTGSPLLTEEGYVGEDVHFAARVASRPRRPDPALQGDHSLVDGVSHIAGLPPAQGRRRAGDDLPARRGDFPRLKTIANSNLPTPASSFLGREDELHEADANSRRRACSPSPARAAPARRASRSSWPRRAREERFSDYEDGVFAASSPACAIRSRADHDRRLSRVREQPGQSVAERSRTPRRQEAAAAARQPRALIGAVPALSALLSACPGLTILCHVPGASAPAGRACLRAASAARGRVGRALL